ncbi:hypothetical protein BGZ75_004555 [Mortierella antarctica]|nr:hypothetical protein BGZ67_006444 [Mortierella alpina]KAF9983889.1 hypothetical protein BGZ75_004555 [Mortierella antarctica]
MLFTKSLLLIGAATVVMARERFDAIASGALFTGKDNADMEVNKLDTFRDPQNHASAVASILWNGATLAKFIPAADGLATDPYAYQDFLREISHFKGFKKAGEQRRKLELNGRLEQLEEEIDRKYRSFNDDEDINVARHFRQLIPNNLRKEDIYGDRWLLSQIVIRQSPHSNAVSFEVGRIALEIRRERNGRAIIEPQTATLVKTDFRVDEKYLMENAQTLAEWVPVANVRTVLNLLTSKRSPNRGLTHWIFGEEEVAGSCDSGYQGDISEYATRRH